MKKVAIVTGASSGMGREISKIIDKRFTSIDEIWLIARRRSLLEELREEINIPCIIVDDDIADYGFTERFRKMLRQENPMVKILVNAAGYGIMGEFVEAEHEITMGMIDTNCKGMASVTHLVIPYMTERSRIINFTSAAAFIPQPDFAVYAATKSFVLSFSRALNYELNVRKIYVTAVCPGPVATDFFRIAEDGTHKRPWYKDLFMANCKDVAENSINDSISRKAVSIYGFPMKILYIVSKIIPHRLILKIIQMFK